MLSQHQALLTEEKRKGKLFASRPPFRAQAYFSNIASSPFAPPLPSTNECNPTFQAWKVDSLQMPL
jgi:hypothetical protein